MLYRHGLGGFVFLLLKCGLFPLSFGMGAILSCLRLLFNMGHIVCHGALGDSVRIDSLSRLEG